MSPCGAANACCCPKSTWSCRPAGAWASSAATAPASHRCSRRCRANWRPTRATWASATPCAFANEDWEAVAEAHHLLEELNGYDASARAGKLLHGLGFSPETHERAVSTFSGGWRGRLNLARALMTPSGPLLFAE